MSADLLENGISIILIISGYLLTYDNFLVWLPV